MTERVDLFTNIYQHFNDEVVNSVRKDTFGTDIGQNSWLTVDEYERMLPWLNLTADSHVLEVASGSGGPAHYLARTTGCRVTGIDANESGVATASQMVSQMTKNSAEAERVCFKVADANTRAAL